MALTEVDVARLNDDVFAATGTNKNRIINGDMRIDQRNAGASITPASTGAFYSVDRWALETTRANALTLQQVTDAPVGFTNSLRVTVASSVASMSAGDGVGLFQGVEGFNIADLGFGTANAQPITLSFWVKSSVTGTYSWFIRSINDTRCYVGTYSITQANTWEQKIINVQGDSTTFAYDRTNGRGFLFGFALGGGSNFETAGNTWTGVGARTQVTGTLDFISQSNGSTWQVTGVQLEAGDTATPFERRSYGQELALCQRYFYRQDTPVFQNCAYASGAFTSNGQTGVQFPVVMRAAPTVTVSFVNRDNASTVSVSTLGNSVTPHGVRYAFTVLNSLYPYAGIDITSQNSAEL